MFQGMLFYFLYIFYMVWMLVEDICIRGALADMKTNDKIGNVDVLLGRKFTLMYC